MGEPSKADIQAIFKRLRSVQTNKQCFDCGLLNPTWASITYGVFLCIDCSAIHRSLGVHLTFIKSSQLDTNWSWLQMRAMQLGGNANATGFFRQHGCTSQDAQQKYNSRAALMYREKLLSLALKAVHNYGTQLHIDSHRGDPKTPQAKDQDFFKEHVDAPVLEQEPVDAAASLSHSPGTYSQPVPISNGRVANGNDIDPSEGPKVEHALSMSPTSAVKQAEPRKVTIGARKPAGAKKGLGAKKAKGGFGAQKVKANFSEIEASAQQRDRDRELMSKNMEEEAARSKEHQEKKMASMRLAYQDLSVERKRQDEKMKNMDPKKAAQAERLGMGMTGSRGVSHSVMNEMKTIEQETPTRGYERDYDRMDKFSSRGRDKFDDDFEILGGPPKYDDSPFGLKDSYKSNWGSKSSWDRDRDVDRFESKQSKFFDETIPSKTTDDDRSRSRKNYEVSSSEEAQKKFGNAKAISSDQFFGGKDMDFETKSNLQKFEGSSSISSADLFGGGSTQQRNYSGSAGPDLDDIKDSVKQGVTKVAGKLSNLANGVINSIQDRY